MQLARLIYDHLPKHTGANRYDKEWKWRDYSARFYVGEIINKTVRGFNLWINKRDTVTIHLVWPASRISYGSEYIGPEPSTLDSSRIQKNWKPHKGLYLHQPSSNNYQKWQWRLGYASGFFGKFCGWSVAYYDGRVEIWVRKSATRD